MSETSAVTSSYDAIVIGAGAGGLTAAARLTAAGKKVLVVEAMGRVGGRASSEVIDGHIVNIGAIAIERGGVFEETFDLLNVPLDIREPNPATVFYIDGKVINVAKGGWAMLLGTFTKQAAKIGAKFAEARGGDLPEEKLMTSEWLRQYTKNETVHALFRNLCAAIFACNADELPARAFLVYFAQKGAFKRFGFCPRGTIGLWEDLAGGIKARGNEVWLNAKVTQLHTEGGRVVALDVSRDGGAPQRISTKTVVSNIGPAATVALPGGEAFGADYAARVQREIKPAANIVINFATQTRLLDVPGLVTFGKTRRICNLGELTATCPELAPAGWYQYVCYAVPKPAIGDFDEKVEIEESLKDLREIFPGFADAKMLSIRVMRDGWPAQRSCAGYDMSQDTPLPNLWHVGDAVKDYGDGGTQACAFTARVAAQRAVALLDEVVPA
ncbi:MAG: FAD-dependent oxidoreductase [Burkholderiales bacterium]